MTKGGDWICGEEGRKQFCYFLRIFFWWADSSSTHFGPWVTPNSFLTLQLTSVHWLFINHSSSLSLIKPKQCYKVIITWTPAWWQTWLWQTWDSARGQECTLGSRRKIVLKSIISDKICHHQNVHHLYWCRWPCHPPSWLPRRWPHPACSGSHKESRPSGSEPSRYHWKKYSHDYFRIKQNGSLRNACAGWRIDGWLW